MMQMSERPDVTYNDIGGMDVQKQEIREAVELAITHHELYNQIGTPKTALAQFARRSPSLLMGSFAIRY